MRYVRKKKRTNESFTILYDDRENNHWQFLSNRWTMKKKRLKTGDYSIEGFEDVVAIEKKSGFEELFANLTGKERPRFERFLRRLSKYPIKCIIVEDELRHLERVWMIMKRKAPKTRLLPSTIPYWVAKIVVEYKIPVLFVPDCYQKVLTVESVFAEVVNQCTLLKK